MADPSPSSQRYMVTARKYRPNLFNELVAQEHVSDTLKNAIRLDRLAHAYLFSGPRGVGKTTAARILAKAINCTTPLDQRTDRAEPCRECESCRSFEEGRSLGIFEIDAASNNKVDDIRELRETVRVPPQGSRKKVYIIDEVHMLSNQAFNALLKTLEEPPPHVLFIFATTEPHKVLPTILSRCQRFDFRRIPVPDIVERLREICAEEGIEADEESLILIARKGDGALRDALSAFDQAVSLCGSKLQYAELAQALGVVDVELFFRLTDHIAERQSSGVLELMEEVVRSGYDLQEFLAGVAEHLRNLLVAASMSDYSLIEAAESTRARYAEQAKRFSESDLLRLLMVAGEAEEDVKSSVQPRLKLEMALLKMASLSQTADLQKALSQLDRLEKAVDEGKTITIRQEPAQTAKPENRSEENENGAAPEPTADAPPPVKPGDRSESADEGPAPEPTPSTRKNKKQSSPKEPGAGQDDDSAESSPAEAPADDAEETVEESTPSAPSPPRSPAPVKETRDDRPDPAANESASSYRTLFNKPALGNTSDSNGGSPENYSGDGATATVVAEPVEATVEADTGLIEEHWEAFLEAIREDSIMLSSYLLRSRPIGLESEVLRLAVPDGHSRDLLRNAHTYLVSQLPDPLQEETERFQFVIQNDLEDAGNGETAVESDPYETLKRMRQEHDVVRAIFDKFGGEIVH